MLIPTLFLTACLASQPKIEAPHDQNPVFIQILKQGLEVGGKIIMLPAPALVDGQDAESQRAAIGKLVGPGRSLDELLRDSVTAPFIIKVHDMKTAGATVRQLDLAFAVHGDLSQVDPAKEAARTSDKPVEVANMWFQTRLLKAEDLRVVGVKEGDAGSGENSWYAHIHAKLLDRIDFEVTNHVVTTKSKDSIVLASATDPSFAKAGQLSNGWASLSSSASSEKSTPARQPYAGGISYAKISRIVFQPATLFVEMHVAFVEPDGWFQGAPILRSKFGVVAQDQIRTLRREAAKKRAK